MENLASLTIIPTKETKKIVLDKEGSCWITVTMLPKELIEQSYNDYDKLYALKTGGKLKIIHYDKDQIAHRTYNSYLATPPLNLKKLSERSSSYMFGDTSCEANEFNPLPEDYKVYFDYMNLCDSYNQVVANYYDNGTEYIPYHADWKDNMVKYANIATLTFCKTDETKHPHKIREFIIKPNKDTHANYKKVIVKTTHGSIIKMHGLTQDKFKHGIPTNSSDESRMSLSFRLFD